MFWQDRSKVMGAYYLHLNCSFSSRICMGWKWEIVWKFTPGEHIEDIEVFSKTSELIIKTKCRKPFINHPNCSFFVASLLCLIVCASWKLGQLTVGTAWDILGNLTYRFLIDDVWCQEGLSQLQKMEASVSSEEKVEALVGCVHAMHFEVMCWCKDMCYQDASDLLNV